MDITFRVADTDKEFESGKKLFLEYANSLGVDLSFQDFPDELINIRTQYNRPKGALLLAYDKKEAIGCVGIREFDSEIAELKRMFIFKEYQGCKIGRKMLDMIVDVAKQLGYKKIRLDTLPDMTTAQNLYRASGFYEIPAYRFNPIEGTVFLEKLL